MSLVVPVLLGRLFLKAPPMTEYESPFPSGLIVFFRVMDSGTNQLARSYHLTGRVVEINKPDGPPDDYIVKDENYKILGIYPRDFVSAILPIITTGPGATNVDSSEEQPPHKQEAKTRNPSKLS